MRGEGRAGDGAFPVFCVCMGKEGVRQRKSSAGQVPPLRLFAESSALLPGLRELGARKRMKPRATILCGRSAAGGKASAEVRRRCSGRGQKTPHGKTSDGVQGVFRTEALGIRRAERARPGAGFRSVKTFGLRRRCGLRDHRKGRNRRHGSPCSLRALGDRGSRQVRPVQTGRVRRQEKPAGRMKKLPPRSFGRGTGVREIYLSGMFSC